MTTRATWATRATRATTSRATARELAVVFLGVLLAAFIARRLRPIEPWVAREGTRSLLALALLGTLAFGSLRAVGGYWLARVFTGLLLLAFVCSTVAVMVGKRLATPPELDPIPNGLVRVADWLADRPPSWQLRAPAITIRADRHLVIDGTPEESFSYLAIAKAQHLQGGTYLVVEGVLSTGGVTIGLQQTDTWIAFTTLLRPGPFRSWAIVPRDGDYRLVVAYGVTARVPTQVEFTPLTLWR